MFLRSVPGDLFNLLVSKSCVAPMAVFAKLAVAVQLAAHADLARSGRLGTARLRGDARRLCSLALLLVVLVVYL